MDENEVIHRSIAEIDGNIRNVDDLDRWTRKKLNKLENYICDCRNQDKGVLEKNIIPIFYIAIASGFSDMVVSILDIEEFKPELLDYHTVLESCTAEIFDIEWDQDVERYIMEQKFSILTKYQDQMMTVDILNEFNQRIITPNSLSYQDEFWCHALYPLVKNRLDHQNIIGIDAQTLSKTRLNLSIYRDIFNTR